jgi:hypothetical protein
MKSNIKISFNNLLLGLLLILIFFTLLIYRRGDEPGWSLPYFLIVFYLLWIANRGICLYILGIFTSLAIAIDYSMSTRKSLEENNKSLRHMEVDLINALEREWELGELKSRFVTMAFPELSFGIKLDAINGVIYGTSFKLYDDII